MSYNNKESITDYKLFPVYYDYDVKDWMNFGVSSLIIYTIYNISWS